MALISSFSVTFNLGYRKYYRPDQLVTVMQTNNRYPLLIITSYKSLVQVGEMMGIAWEFQQKLPELKPQFMLVSPKKSANIALKSAQPFELWLVNWQNSIDLSTCQPAAQSSGYVTGYEYQKFLCGR
jgi:uncharacterized membrane protein